MTRLLAFEGLRPPRCDRSGSGSGTGTDR